MKNQQAFFRMVKISGKIGIILSVAHFFGPFAWKGILAGLAVKEHITLKKQSAISKGIPFHLYEFSNQKQTSFFYYDLSNIKSSSKKEWV